MAKMNTFNRHSDQPKVTAAEDRVRGLCLRGERLLKEGDTAVQKGHVKLAVHDYHELIHVVAVINTIVQDNSGISNSTIEQTQKLKIAIAEQFGHYRDKSVELIDSKDYGKAAFFLTAAAALEVGSFDSAFRLAAIYTLFKNYVKAQEVFKSVISVDPENFVAYRELGWNYAPQSEFNKAIKYLNKAINLAPEDGTSHYYAAICYAAIGDSVNGKIHGEKARTLGVDQTLQPKFKEKLAELGVSL